MSTDHELLEPMGHVGMGEGWRARHRALGHEAAVEVVTAGLGEEGFDR